MCFSNFQCITRLNNHCHPDELQDFVWHGSYDPKRVSLHKETVQFECYLPPLIFVLYFSNFQCITRLNNRCHPDELRDFVEHGSHDPEEFPFMEEQSILRRLEATLFTLRNWSVTKSKAAVNNWHVRDFVLITQGDLLNTQDCYTLLQVSQPFFKTFLQFCNSIIIKL